MGMVKVWNDNTHVYKEKFKGDNIVISAKNYITMEEGEALLFKGTFSSIMKDADGNHDPRGFKKIRLEKIKEENDEPKIVETNRCNVCKFIAVTQLELTEHEKIHAGQALVDEAAEKELKKKKSVK